MLIEQLAKEGRHGDKIDNIVGSEQNTMLSQEENSPMREKEENVKEQKMDDVTVVSDAQEPIDAPEEEKVVSPRLDKSSWIVATIAPVTPVVNLDSPPVKSGKQTLNEVEWPSLVRISEVEEANADFASPMNVAANYTVQSPDSESPVMSPVEKVQAEIDRTSSRNQQMKMAHVMEQASKLSKKRDLEDT